MDDHHRGPVRCTADYVALHARRRPTHLAVLSDGAGTSYATLNAQLECMTRTLSRLELPRSAIVALAHPDIHLRLLVMLAFERLALCVASFRSDEGEAADGVLALVDLVMSPAALAPERCKRFLRMDQEWVDAALSPDRTPGSFARLSTTDPVLLIRSSGSTGRPKLMTLTRAMLSARLAQRVGAMGRQRRDDRFLALQHFTVATVLYSSLACLRLGATVIADNRVAVAEALARSRPTCASMLPYQLVLLLNATEPLVRAPDLRLMVGGGKVSPALRRQALEHVCGEVIHFYGCNETSVICTFDEDELGIPMPGADVDIVGDDGVSLPPTSVGEIRVRGPAVIDGYYGDASSGMPNPRDGWWHTGDFGSFTPAGLLKLLGRRDDVINLGGIKRAAADMEAEIAATGIAADVAVIAGEQHDGGPMTLIVVATSSEAAARKVAEFVEPILFGRFAVFRVDAIPRTPDGKVRHVALRELVPRLQPALPAYAD